MKQRHWSNASIARACDARWERGHRRVGYALAGKLRTPGRHAVDWVKLDDGGRKSPAAGDVAADTYSHGEDVLAVADGVVSRVVDSMPERLRLSDEVFRAEGNTVVLELANGHYAHYGHLKPGSAVVKPGMRVRAGDKIAEVGFSGSASDPQLHFRWRALRLPRPADLRQPDGNHMSRRLSGSRMSSSPQALISAT